MLVTMRKYGKQMVDLDLMTWIIIRHSIQYYQVVNK
jgi:hypothetical protein